MPSSECRPVTSRITDTKSQRVPKRAHELQVSYLRDFGESVSGRQHTTDRGLPRRVDIRYERSSLLTSGSSDDVVGRRGVVVVVERSWRRSNSSR